MPFSLLRRLVACFALALVLSPAYAQWAMEPVAPPASPTFENGQAAAVVLGQPGFSSAAPGGGTSGLHSVQGIAVDPINGVAYVAESGNHRVLRYGSLAALRDGQPAEAVFGQASFNGRFPNRGLLPSASTLFFPVAVAVDLAGRLYVTDSGNHRVLRFDHAATAASGAAADGVLGQADFTHGFANRGAEVGPGTLSLPRGLAVDAAGRLYVTDLGNHRVLWFDDAARRSSGARADGVLGQPDFAAADANRGGTPGPATLFHPRDVAVDPNGRLFVADAFNHRVLRFDDAARLSNGAPADGVLGQPDFSTGDANRGGTPGPATFDQPKALALDDAGRLYVTDGLNHRVLRFDNAAQLSNGAPAGGVLGQPDFARTEPGTSERGMRLPTAVAFDPAHGQLFVAEFGNHRVVVFRPEPAAPFSPLSEPWLGPAPAVDVLAGTTEVEVDGGWRAMLLGTRATVEAAEGLAASGIPMPNPSVLAVR